MKRSHRTIQKWVANGMPTRLHDGPHGKHHLVREDELYAWLRARLLADSALQARRRNLPRHAEE